MIVLLLYAFSLLKSVFFAQYGLNMIFDDGQMLLNATRILEGQIIYQDFQSFFPPIMDYHAANVLMLSKDIVFIRVLHSLLAATISVLVYKHLRGLGVNKYLSVASALVVILIPARPDKYYIHAYIIASFIALYEYIIKGGKKHLWYSGILIAIASVFRYDLALYSYLAGAATLFFFTKSHKVKSVICYLIPAALIWAVHLGVLHSAGLLEGFITQALIVPYAVTQQLHKNVLFPNFDPLDIASYAELLQSALYWFYFVTVISGGLLLVSKKLKREIKLTVFYAFSIAVLSIFYVLGNMDSGHILKGALFFVLIIPFGYKYAPKLLGKAYLLAFFLIIVGFLVQSVWILRFYDSKADLSKLGSVRINSSYISGTSRPSAQTLEEAVDFLRQAKGENVIALPQHSALYYAANKNSPLVYAAILQSYTYEPFDEKYIVEEIESANIERIVYDPDGGVLRSHGGFRNQYPTVHEYILANYKVIKTTPEGWLFMLGEK